MNNITNFPAIVLANITDFSGIQALGRFSETSRTALAFFNSGEPWMHHAELVGLPRGLRLLAHVKAFYEELPEVKKRFTTEIENYKEVPLKYPEEVEGLAEKAKSYQDLLQMKQVLSDHLYAKVLYVMACNRVINLTPPTGGAASASGNDTVSGSYTFTHPTETNSRMFPNTIAELRDLASRKGLLTDPSAIKTMNVQMEPAAIEGLRAILGSNHRIITTQIMKCFNLGGPIFSVPEEIFCLDVDNLTIDAPIQSLPDFTRDHSQHCMLEIRSSALRTLPSSIGRLVSLRCINLHMCGFETIPRELLLIPELKEVKLPPSLVDMQDSQVVKDLLAKGVGVTFPSEDDDSDFEWSDEQDDD